jgi:hypothetical protein
LIQVGVVASFSPTESRDVEQIRGIGFGDQIAELVPGVTQAMTISVVRTALYLANVMQVFGYNAGTSGVVRSLRASQVSIRHQARADLLYLCRRTKALRAPRMLRFSGNSVKALITFFEGCWMTSWSSEFTSEAAMVQENVEMIVTDITDGSSTYNEFISARSVWRW